MPGNPANEGGVEIPGGAGPLVLIAPTTAHEGGALLEAAVSAVARLGVRAVVTAGAGAVPAALPARVAAAPFAPHGPLVAAAAAVVCNGGHGIVARALSAGVPLVIVPGHGDQPENAARVARAGAGIVVARASAPALRRALTRVLRRRRYRRRAAMFAREAESLDGPARAAELIEALVAGRVPRSPGPG